MRFTVQTNDDTQTFIEELMNEHTIPANRILNFVSSLYKETLQENEDLKQQLSELKRDNLSILRSVEDKVSVLYELENTRQVYEKFQEFYATANQKSDIFSKAEMEVERLRSERILKKFEKFVGN
jgi:hypothetical protein